MLHVIISDGSWRPKDLVYNASGLFDLVFENDWIVNPIMIDAIAGIDKSKVIRPRIIESPILGDIAPRELSGGVKLVGLLLNWEEPVIYSLSNAGSNCTKWIQMACADKDRTGFLCYPMEMSDEAPMNIHIINDDSYPRTPKEFMHSYLRCKYDWETFYKITKYEVEVQLNI